MKNLAQNASNLKNPAHMLLLEDVMPTLDAIKLTLISSTHSKQPNNLNIAIPINFNFYTWSTCTEINIDKFFHNNIQLFPKWLH